MVTSTHYPAFEKKTEVLLCLTSLRHRRYVEDVINLVGLPPGARIRLRYRKSYVSRHVLQRIDAGDLQNCQIIVALGSSTEAEATRIAPMRSGRVVQATYQGELFMLDVALDAFLFESEPAGHFGAEIGMFGLDMPKHFRSDIKAPGMYVNLVNKPITTLLAGLDVVAWEKVAKRVLELDDIQHAKSPCIPFAYLLTGLPNHVQQRLSHTGDLIIESGSRVSFDLHSLARSKGTILRNPIGEIVLNLSHPSASFATSRRLRVDSPRDVKRIQLNGASLFRRARGHLSLRVVDFQTVEREQVCVERAMAKDDRVEAALARYDVPLIIGRFHPILASLLLALSSASLAWDAPSGGGVTLASLVVPGFVGLLAFTALALGFWKDGSA